jgi:PKD domain-containing protein
MLFFLCCASILQAQEKVPIEIEKTEKEIDNYISRELTKFNLTPEYINRVRENILMENKEHHIVFDEKSFEKTLLEIKKYELRKIFFERYPEKKAPYEYPLTRRDVQQACNDGGFENGAPATVYTIRQALNPPVLGGNPTQIQTNTPSFVNQALSGTLNNFNAFATLVSPGFDPLIPTLPRVLNGNRAIKLNIAQTAANGQFNVVTLSRNLAINEANLDINYSVILNDPGVSHTLNQKPFFLIRLYDNLGNIIRTVNVLTNPQDCSLNSTNPTAGNNGPFLFTNWNCARINTNDLIGQNVRLEFIIADCAFGGHFGTVYIDDFCNTNCANPLFGDINLNPIQTITCPTTTQTICGTYQIPANSAYSNISLQIMQGNTVVSTISAPSTLTSNTFCFNVSPSDFGPNPNGNFEFRVRGTFIRQCAINFQLDPIFDNSANDTGPDVAFNNCIDAVNDSVTYSTCTLGSFSVLENDTVFGNPAAPGNVIITQISSVIPQLSLNTATGQINVASGAAPGIYNLIYRICNLNNPTHCDTATATVTITPPMLNAENNDFSVSPINACTGGTTSSVLKNDSFCGTFLNNSLFTVTLINNGGLTGATINSSGNITIPPAVVPGNYTLTYQLCQISNPSNCDTATVLIKINPGVTPIFNFPTTLCRGSVAPILLNISDNGIQGAWVPAVVSNVSSGNYTFTPSGQCATPVTIPVTVIPGCGIFISWGSDVSCQLTEEDPRIKFSENIVDGPCIRVCENSTITYTLTGDTANIDHTVWNITGGTVLNPTNTSVTVNWSSASFCALQGTIYLTDGTTKEINKCIEKLEAPNALFSALPDLNSTEIYGCTDNPIHFENLTTSAGGNEVIYYNWDFGDGTFSSEFEPSHVYNHSGTYTVVLVAYNGCSCSSKYDIKVIIDEGSVPIQCPSVVCEGNKAHYSIPKEYGDGCRIDWEVIGGEIASIYNNDTEIDIVWNHIDEDGFGYVSVKSDDCFKCKTTIKVPVVQLKGTIKGVDTMCPQSQNIFSLPKWPTTEFNWRLEDNGTGADLLYNNQRNEVVIQSGVSGTIELFCNYKNTLLGCGGTARITIEVKPLVNLVGPMTICENTSAQYQIQDETGSNISPINWVITGPSGFSQSGTGSPFNIVFPTQGVYNFRVNSPNYCASDFYNINLLDNPAAPTVISGPLTICPGIPVNYTCIPPAGGTTHWQVTNGTIIGSDIGNQIVVNFNPLATGTFEVKAWYEYEGCMSGVYTITPVREIPDLTLTENASVVCGSSYANYAVSNSLSVDNYTWSVVPETAGSIQSGQNSNEVTVLWNQTPGNVQLRLNVRKCGGIFSQLYPVQIINTSQITINAPTTACSNVAIPMSFSMSPGTAFTNVTWDFGDGSLPVTTTGNNVSHQFIVGGNASANLTITATVTGANGCPMPAIATHQIVVSPTPEVSITPNRSLNLCDPDNIPADYTYSVTMQGGFGATDTVQWYSGTYPSGTPIFPGGTNSTITLNTVGNYYAIVTNSFGCSKNTQSIIVYSDCPSGSGGCEAIHNIDAEVTNTSCQGITANVTLVEGSPYEVLWSDYNAVGGNVVSVSSSQLQIENIEPGEYTITLNANYNIGGDVCHKDKQIPFIVPYKAGIRYNIACAENTGYNVTLYDFSKYYPLTPATSFEFTTDNGTTWQTGSVISGIAQITTQLAPGTYNVGIRIARAGYQACEKIIPIVLPAMPSASFHFDNNACQDTAMQFYADDTTPGLQYSWNFGTDAINLQQNPVRTFTGNGPKQVILTVTNKYGCSVSLMQEVNVRSIRLRGTLNATPVNVCQGSTIAINYTPNSSQIMPTQFNWYYNNFTPTPFATTSTPNLTVSQSGQYFVYVTDANGCRNYTNPPVSVAFVPSPEPPKVSGPKVVCSGNAYTIKVPQNSNVRYIWSLNGVAQPQWDYMNEITDMQSALGSYVYSVIAQVQDDAGNYCSSNPVTHTVSVINQPNIPQLDFNVVSCNPYHVKVMVLNPQPGISYYWSNGDIGTDTDSYHDGPIQVRAETSDCSVTSQIDLPIDLESVAWVFPKGCFEFCKEKLEGYIVGPFGNYQEWQWQENNNPIIYGSDIVLPFDQFSPGHDYQLYLNNGYCDYTVANMSIQQKKDCEECQISYRARDIECVKIDGVYIYSIVLDITNQFGTDVWTTLTAPDGEGFFIDNTFLVPGSTTSTFTVYFYQQSGFNGGTIDIDINGSWKENGSCYRKSSLELPSCDPPRIVENGGVEDILVLGNDLLLVAPNPAQEKTTVIYGYKNPEGNKTIEIRDMLGRHLNTWPISMEKGTLQIDCNNFAAGQYYILMKENDTIIKQSRLIINH